MTARAEGKLRERFVDAENRRCGNIWGGTQPARENIAKSFHSSHEQYERSKIPPLAAPRERSLGGRNDSRTRCALEAVPASCSHLSAAATGVRVHARRDEWSVARRWGAGVAQVA